ncbi:MAG: excalibur calcium-binding domain-containing protein [Sulfitobacter sp.]
MINRIILVAMAAGVLSACQPAIPDSGRGVGFDNSREALRQREAALARSNAAVPAPSEVTSAPLGATGATDTSAAATAAETSRVLAATRTPTTNAPANDQLAGLAQANSGVEPLQASPSNPRPESNAGISDENDFGAVSERQSIESDAARIASNRAQYEVVQPEALPSRSDQGQPNIVAFALQTGHPVGQKQYTRSGFTRQAKFERNCAAFASADQAQIEFLSRGGPKRDRKGLDPDGDGYACSWDPAPYRKASQG